MRSLGAPPYRRQLVQAPVLGHRVRRTPHDFSLHHRRRGEGHRIRGSAPGRTQRRSAPAEQRCCAIADGLEFVGGGVGAAGVFDTSRMSRLSASSLKNVGLAPA